MHGLYQTYFKKNLPKKFQGIFVWLNIGLCKIPADKLQGCAISLEY